MQIHRVAWAIAALAAAVAIGATTLLVVDRKTTRPELQRVLEDAVRANIAPGAAAYVSGPAGTWGGAAGLVDADARMRLESVSKIYTAALIERLDQEGRLRVTQTVEHWLPGLLPYGKRITIRQLMTMTSGLIDNNDFVNASDAVARGYLARVKDAKLRAQLLAVAARVERDPSTEFSPLLWIRYAAWQPLLFTPGAGSHYSNIGYEILGLIAVRAGGAPLDALYRSRIFEPLGLRATAYDPQGPISGSHARGFGRNPGGPWVDATSRHPGIGAEGGIVADARDTATFLRALMQGRIVDRRHVEALMGKDLWLGGASSGCGGNAFGWSGGGTGFKSEVWVSDHGTRVAVLLLNARHLDGDQIEYDTKAHEALVRLYCAA